LAGALEAASSDLFNFSIALDSAAELATITLAGPADVWFGVG
jgi:hypothetical protein